MIPPAYSCGASRYVKNQKSALNLLCNVSLNFGNKLIKCEGLDWSRQHQMYQKPKIPFDPLGRNGIK